MDDDYHQANQLVPYDDQNLVPVENYFSDSENSKESRLNVRSVTSESSIESLDPFSNLPENWEKYDFNRKKSCLLTNIYSTCVTKAINHLDLLQSSMEKWMKKIEKALPESDSSTRTVDSESSKNLMSLMKNRSSIPRRTEMKHIGNFNLDKNDLFEVTGNEIALIEPKELNKQYALMVDDDLKVGGVLEEILVLLARLEFDRRRTQALLDKERASYTKLKTYVDNLALKRATELPAQVQREHDTCINDITELNWHISFNIKSERKLIRKVEIEERFHEQLKDEITGVKLNFPLIQEKIKIEVEYLDKITSAQTNVNDLLGKAKERMKQTQEKSEISQNKAAQEREMIKAELDSSKRELNKTKKRLQEAENKHKEYLETLAKSKEKIEQNVAQEKNELTVKLHLKAKLQSSIDENTEIVSELIRVSKEIERIAQENQTKSVSIDQLSAKYNEEINGLTDILNKKLDKMEKILKKVKEKEIDIEEMTKDKRSMENKIEKEEKNKQRMFDERIKVEDQLNRVILNLDKVIRFNEMTQRDHEAEMKRIGSKEEILKKQISELKKQLNEERFKTSTIMAKMNVEGEDYKRNLEDYTIQKAQFEKKREENDVRLDKLQRKVDEIETIKLNTDLECYNLEKALTDTVSDHNKLETSLTSKLNELEPKHEKVFNIYSENKQNLDYVKKHTQEMKEKMEEMAKSKDIMIKTIQKISEEIEELNLICKEADAKCNAAVELNESSKLSHDQIEKRLKATKQDHSIHLTERTNYLNKLANQLNDFIDLNRELASRYRFLKYNLYNLKINLIDKLESKLGTFVNVKDKREIKLVQEKMHFALKDYFKFKIKASEHDYHKINENRSKLGREINRIEHTFNDSIEHVKEFLDNQIDFSLVRQQAMEKVYKQELIDKQNEEKKNEKKIKMAIKNKSSSQFEEVKSLIKT